MFSLETKEWGNLEVIFKHHNTVVNTPGTECFIGINEEEETLEGYGRSFLSISDQYSKEIGRKVSLRRALLDLGADREQRKAFWYKYFSTQKRK